MKENYLDLKNQANIDFIIKAIDGNEDNYNKLIKSLSNENFPNKDFILFIITQSFNINRRKDLAFHKLKEKMEINELSSADDLYELYINDLEKQLEKQKKENQEKDNIITLLKEKINNNENIINELKNNNAIILEQSNKINILINELKNKNEIITEKTNKNNDLINEIGEENK